MGLGIHVVSQQALAGFDRPCNPPVHWSTRPEIRRLRTVKILGGHGPGQPYFDPNAFVPVSAVRFGTSGQDIIRGPGLFNTDLSLFRTFRLTERFNLQFRNPDGSIKALNGYTEITSASGERQFSQRFLT